MADSIQAAMESARAEHVAKPESAPEQRSEKTTDKPESRTEKTDRPVDDDYVDWAPGWHKQWKRGSRAALKKIAQMEGARELLPEIFKEVEDRYDYSGKRDVEFDKYRKRFDPYDPILSNLEQRFTFQGVSPQVGLQQMAAVSEALQTNPDQIIPWLAQMFRVRDPKALVQALIQSYNVNASELGQDAPFNEHLLSMQHNYLQQNYQQQAHQVVTAIQAFKEAKDENGELKYPHYNRLEPVMTQIMQVQGIQPLEQLYEKALWNDPELREELIEHRARKAENAAIKAAAEKSAETEKALSASRNVNSKQTNGREPKGKDLRGIMENIAKKHRS
jgi:hypothetical protein